MALSDQPADVSEFRSKWGWFVALGIALLVLGVVAAANLLVATVASVYFVGTLMIVAGVVEIVHAFGVKGWGSFFLWLLGGALYIVAGYLAFINPLLASAILTLFLAASLVASGVMRIWMGIKGRSVLNSWGWIVAAGVVTVLAGLIIAAGWPVSSLVVLGTFLAIDLIFQGATYIAFGLGLRRVS
ncbi:HdeD family acid-resistance protein [Mesorhizobium sp. CC13]|uniref:HdeD family acid-resistance protein n=1 Tax=Mesorhizobium sp. CC13 TaxID=3029194 RepID=UPI003263EE30